MAVIGVAFYVRMQDRGAGATDAREVVHSFLTATPRAATSADTIDRPEAAAHRGAFDAAYSVGKRDNQFDVDEYCNRFCEVMHAAAAERSAPEITTHLKACELAYHRAQGAGTEEA